ncbi:MAG: multifunctional oxoglutarate decarboxylase/oxoglutarate dehydrogenase thiamine pyrophosphate-binding subunit/dihydrolipoyllysine-residue succinyltransferase subunit, partial [Actinobacteria bacterium]|nr:multifunctional oxoglutarate decarboxylase/oxoglutarate dehydrogenase thiamine pyrophosphate-binding subunit/dihydrolipoyllysine-residue succinyltransferase subunit [Actinomycetota bacterium]
MSRGGMGKVSFTHIIGYAIVRAIADAVPAMNNSYATDDAGAPHIIRNPEVNMGLAVDVAKSDGSRTLVVPVLRNTGGLSFAGFLNSYEELVRKVKTNKLAVTDFQGATITLTNPGTIGTVQSVPRLMPGQGVIVGVGSIDYPAEFQGSDERALSKLGVSKVVTVTSTYDHRIIQGAESGMFLKRVHELLIGQHAFYDDIFESLGVPYKAEQWRTDNNASDTEEQMLHKQMQVANIIRAHRVRGHLMADLDPLRWKEPVLPAELDPSTYGLTIWDLERSFLTGGVGGVDRQELGDLLSELRETYCSTIGIEYMHIQNTEEQRWLQARLEGVTFKPSLSQKNRIMERLNAAEAFEKFLATKYVGTKRFGLDGCETAIPVIDTILSAAAAEHLDGAVIGMSHRGRLNVLANVVGKSYDQIFKEFEGHIKPDSVQGSGDVKYHLGAHGKFTSAEGDVIDIELAANPSHLETVDPIVMGMVRAAQDGINPPLAFSVLPLLIHGDAAFAGQGLVAECLAMSDLSGYRVGGTIHLIINNQIGFTTAPQFSRSSVYSSDVAKTVQAPIFHVNGDDPEACVRVAKIAYDYRQKFHKDVVIDLIGYRRLGHNEGDDPSYTQPLMYKAIAEHRSSRKMYVETLVKRGDITVDQAEQHLLDYQSKLQSALDETRAHAPVPIKAPKPPLPAGVVPHVNTGVDRSVIETIFAKLTQYPEGFTPHPKLAKQFELREKTFREEGEVEWAVGEAFAIGSLLLEGTSVRLTGEDTRRGTFSQRHAALIDYENERNWVPLAELPTDKANFWVYDSLLSEYGALGFEYGYAHANHDALVAWEAQFGDFVNGAQIVIDQYIVAAEDKWGQQNGLVMLLPHGYEGQGPEHSSARIERFLQLCAEDNIQVCNATTAAQYFHLLRRQVRRDIRKPLVVFTPKQPLRMKESRSKIEDFTHGSFEEVLGDVAAPAAETVKRVVICSGKVAWDAMSERTKRNAPVAVVRIEQLYPFPLDQLVAEIEKYPNAEELVWLQEEPENMGPWHFVEHRIWRLKERGYDLRHVARVESGSPATGSMAIHQQELADLMDGALDAWK